MICGLRNTSSSNGAGVRSLETIILQIIILSETGFNATNIRYFPTLSQLKYRPSGEIAFILKEQSMGRLLLPMVRKSGGFRFID